MVRICLIHGPNLNLLGSREPEFYGRDAFDEINRKIKSQAQSMDMEVKIIQSNHEGEIIDALHEAREWADAVIINPAAYSHYSYAIRDAITAVRLPTVEVHMSNIHSREEFRHTSVVSPVVVGQIVGFGTFSYLLALEAAKNLVEQSHR